MRMSPVTKNILVVLVAVLGFAAFVVLAEGVGGDSDAQDRLDALQANTTTTFFEEEPETTTTTFFVATTTTAPVTVTTAASTTATTKKPTTATTKKPTTATTVRRTTTTAAPAGVPVPHNGPGSEASDNKTVFVHNSNNTFDSSSTTPPAGPDPFTFTIKSEQGSGGITNDAASVKFIVTIKNHTARTVTFPGGLKIIVTVQKPNNGGPLTFTMDASSVANLAPNEGVTVSSTTGISGMGQFEATATCDVDYGS